MKIIVDGENIIESYLPIDPSENRWKFPFCLPTDPGGKYIVSQDGVEFIPVDEKLLWENPYIKINKYFDSVYTGVSKQGISLLTFEVDYNNSDEYVIELAVYPSFVCVFNGKLQIIFRLKDFIPRIAKQPTWFYLDDTIEYVADYLKAELMDVVINPYCNKVKSYIFNTDGLNLQEINKVLPEARIEELREDARIGRAKSGARTAKIKSAKSMVIILKVVLDLQREGKPYTQKLVSEMCGRSRKTVNKHWPKVMSLIGSKEKL
jgi:hypothetical protein